MKNVKKNNSFAKWILFMTLLVFTTTSIFAQNITVKGTVVDETGQPAIGVSVQIKGTTQGAATDVNGEFTLNTQKNATLIFSYLGYKTQEIAATPNMRIKLSPSTELLEEVVVTGYGGSQSRAKATNSIAKVDNKKLDVGVFSNPAQALSGAVSGLRVIQNSGNPGSAPRIILRGGTNLDGSGSPLVIVDGQMRGGLNDINPEDIEDMQVMKDAGATAIYGARANNGVILITTKKGKNGSSEINFKTKLGINYLNNPYQFINAEEYLYWMRNAYVKSATVWQRSNGTNVGYSNLSGLTGPQPYGTGNLYFDNDGVTPLDFSTKSIWSTMYLTDQNKFLLNNGWQQMRDPIYDFMKSQYPNDATIGEYLIFKNTNPADFNFKNPSYTQDYNLNFSGGNDKGHYYAGMGYNHSQGLPISSYYKRYSFLLNGDYKIKPWLTSISNFSFTRANWQSMPGSQTSEANYFSRVISLPPTVRFTNEDGTPRLGNNASDGNQSFQPGKWSVFNQTDKFTMNQSLKIDFLRNLYLKLSGNVFYNEGFFESFTKDFLNTPTSWNRDRNSGASFDRTLDQTYNAVLNYDKQWNDHYFTVMAGTEFYDSYSYGLSASGSGAVTDDFADLSLTTKEKDKRYIDSYHVRQRILSFFGRANYDYMSKYMLSLVLRRDGYSRLIDNRWGTFPGVSAGWVFSKEDFMKNQNIISFAKLRSSYGLNGNVSGIGPYELQGSYVGSTKYNGESTFVLGSVPNPSLRWEKTRTFEVGLDLSYLENKYYSNITFYDRLTSDKFATYSFPISSGISGIRTNNGQFRNTGVELELGAKPIQTKDWNFSMDMKLSYNKNKIVKLPDNGLLYNRQGGAQIYTGNGNELIWIGGYQEGQEPGILYGFQADGIYKDASEIPANMKVMPYSFQGGTTRTLYGKDNWAAMTEAQKIASKGFPIMPGDVKWKDVNGDNVIDDYDQVKIGNTTPHWMGGFNTNLSYKNLSLYMGLDFALDFWVMDYRLPWIMGNMQGTYAPSKEVKETWTPENPSAKYPNYMWADQLGKGNYRNSTLFAYKGDYLSFRQISLTYSFPQAWINRAKIQRLDLSVTGQNLGYLTAAKKMTNPEEGGIVDAGYGLPRTLSFGLNVTF